MEGGKGDEKDLMGWEIGKRKVSFGYLGSGSRVGFFMKCLDEVLVFMCFLC